mgnify:CR=1 FL=1
MDPHALMDQIAFVFQNSRLLKGSILDNVRLGRPQAAEADVLAALKAAQCMDIIEKLPAGIHTVIGTKGVYLSGGEQQRIAIARAFARGTEVMLVDEATASLDPQTASQINQVLLEKEGLTLIAITHRTNQELLEAYDEVLVLEQGELLEHGSYGSLSPQRKQLLALH